MVKSITAPSLLYSLVALAAVAGAYETLSHINTLTYKVVVVFITLIILSNCAAKLYGRLILKENL